MSIPSGRLVVPNALSSYRGCLCMPKQLGGKRWNMLFAKATGKHSLDWMLRQMFPLFRSWPLKPHKGRFGRSTMMFTNQRGCQDPTVQPIMGWWTGPGNHDLLEGAPVAKAGFCHARRRTRMGPHQNLHAWSSSWGPLEDMQRNDDSCDHALAKARGTHQWALAAAHLLEERIERFSCSVTRMQTINCWHSHSHSHSRRWSQGALTPQWGSFKGPKGEMSPISQS